MTTFVGDIDDLIAILQDAKKNGIKYYAMSNDLDGQQYAPNSKNKTFGIRFAISAKAFNSNDLRILFKSTKLAVFLFKNDDMFSEDAKRLIEESAKNREAAKSSEAKPEGGAEA